MDEIPVVDIEVLKSLKNNLSVLTPEENFIAKQISHAIESKGFFFLTNHGIDSKTVYLISKQIV